MGSHENKQEPERALLLCADTGAFNARSSMDELERLAETAGAEVKGRLMQKIPSVHPATYIGAGKIEEVRRFCEEHGIDLIVADDELTPAQLNNIERICGVRAIDRTMLILDIFAARAGSSEGKLQVELAQLKYALPFLSGKGKSLSRLGGGIGTRGPGESKLESDRRHIRRRLRTLEAELKKVEKRRELLRARRKKNGVTSVAIVGYTNAGKSTLMNRLTDAGVLTGDRLFATLDPTARRLRLPGGREVMLIDTVGLVRRLPHELINAFRSTLEEAENADLILNVCDASDPDCAEQLEVSSKLLDSLGCGRTPVISVMNKCDRLPGLADLPVVGKSVCISALLGGGMERLLRLIADTLAQRGGCAAL